MIVQSTIMQMKSHNKKDEKDIHQIGIYGEWVYIAEQEDPVTVKEALPSQDAAKWRKTMGTS